MKSQLIIFGLFILFTLTHCRITRDAQFERKHQHRGIRQDQNDLRDTELDSSISSEESIEENNGKSGVNFGFHRFWSRRNSIETNGEDGSHRFTHNAEWHKKHGIPLPSNNPNDGTTCHHDHRHHHHHHRTTTPSTTTTTTPSTTTTTTPSTTPTTTTTSYTNNEIDQRIFNELDDVEMINRDP